VIGRCKTDPLRCVIGFHQKSRVGSPSDRAFAPRLPRLRNPDQLAAAIASIAPYVTPKWRVNFGSRSRPGQSWKPVGTQIQSSMPPDQCGRPRKTRPVLAGSARWLVKNLGSPTGPVCRLPDLERYKLANLRRNVSIPEGCRFGFCSAVRVAYNALGQKVRKIGEEDRV
jgi:hypothetical protein